MTGRKISQAEFRRNYVNVNPREINSPIKPEPEQQMIYNPVTLRYDAIVGMTDKAVCIQFEKDGEEHWFPRSLSRINKRVKQITVPKKFIQDKEVMDKEVERSDGTSDPKSLTEFFDRQKDEQR